MRWPLLLVVGLSFGGCAKDAESNRGSDPSQVALPLQTDLVDKPPLDLSLYNRCAISMDNFRCTYSNGKSNDLCKYGWQADGVFDGSTFRASQRSAVGTGQASTDMAVVVDFERMVVESFIASYRLEAADDTTTYSIQGKQIPLRRLDEERFQLEFGLRGPQVTDHIDDVSHDVVLSEWRLGSFSMREYFTSELSGIRIYIHYVP